MKKFIFSLVLSSMALAQDTATNQHEENCLQSHSIAHRAPAGVMGAHVHREGEWMVGLRSMYMSMDGLRDGTNRVSTSKAHDKGYMVVPKDMSMQMQMIDIMYGLNDDLTLMAMIPWVRYSMNLNRRMMGMEENFKVRNEGLGDIKLGSIYRAYENDRDQVLLGLTLSLPTADFDQEKNTPMGSDTRLGYPMQIGSGTWDFTPSVTFQQFYSDWSWGTKLEATIHTDTNSEGYRRGDTLDWNIWANKEITSTFALNSRLQFSAWEDYHGHDDKLEMMKNMNPVADADLRSGKSSMVFGGFSWKIGSNTLFQLEAGVPIYQEIDGPNLETDYQVNMTCLVTF